MTAPGVDRPSRPGAGAILNPPRAAVAASVCLAGAFTAGAAPASPEPYVLMAAAALLFAAGSAFEQHFDRLEQRRAGLGAPGARGAERRGWVLGWALLLPGALLPAAAGRSSALAGIGVALMVVLHAAGTKHVWGWNFAAVGAAYGLAMLLGLTAYPFGVQRGAAAAVAAALYAVGWELLRTVRQPGAPPTTAFVSLLHLAAGVAAALYAATGIFFRWLEAAIFLLLLLALVFPRFVRAAQDPRPAVLFEAAQYGLLGLALLAGALGAGSGGPLSAAALGALCSAAYLALRKWPVPLVTEPRR